MRHDIGRGLRLLAGVLIVSFVLNFVWEMVQLPAFADESGKTFRLGIGASALHCFVPTLGDITVAGLTFVFGWAIHSRPDWIRQLGWRDVVLVSLPLVLLAISVELVNVYVLHRWSYNERMPMVPLLEVGLLPTVQLALLTLLAFAIVGKIIGLRDDYS